MEENQGTGVKGRKIMFPTARKRSKATVAE